MACINYSWIKDSSTRVLVETIAQLRSKHANKAITIIEGRRFFLQKKVRLLWAWTRCLFIEQDLITWQILSIEVQIFFLFLHFFLVSIADSAWTRFLVGDLQKIIVLGRESLNFSTARSVSGIFFSSIAFCCCWNILLLNNRVKRFKDLSP